MKELNRDQIEKALRCLSSEKDVLCKGCPYQKYEGLQCRREVAKDALALIKKLAEEKNDWLLTANLNLERIGELGEVIDELTKENERWRAESEKQSILWKQHFESIFQTAKETIKADTVRKMQSAIKEYYSKSCYRPTQKHPVKHTQIEHLFYIVDQIAKDVSGGK